MLTMQMTVFHAYICTGVIIWTFVYGLLIGWKEHESTSIFRA